MSETVELRVEVPSELNDQLDAVAQALDRPRAWVMEQALASFFQIEDIKQALAEADAGDFATADEVEATFAKWRKTLQHGD
jgi:predicted transcriptional regulator